MPMQGLFETTYGYIYGDRMREFVRKSRATKAGADRVEGPGRTYGAAYQGDRNFRKNRPFFDALKRARLLLSQNPDRRVLFRAYEDGKMVDVVTFVELTKHPKTADTPGVIGIDRFVGVLMTEAKEGRIKDLRFAGTYVCKPNSDHAHAAAVDVFASPASMEYIRRLAFDYQEYFETKYHILYRTISYPDGGTSRIDRGYGGTFHAHNHQSSRGGIDYGCPYARDTDWN